MIKIDGVHLENDLGLRVLEDSAEPMLPSTRDNVLTIPTRHGAYVFNSYLEPRQFAISILIHPQSSLNDVQLIVRKIASLLLDSYGRPKKVKLVYDYETDKYYDVKFSGAIDVERIVRLGKLVIPLTAYDPWAYSTTDNTDVMWGSEEITFQADYLLSHTFVDAKIITSSQTVQASVNGYTVRPTFIISGKGNNVTFSANGKSFSLSNFTNSTWVLDGEKYTVTLNGVNGYAKKTSGWIELMPGLNDIQISGTNMNFTLTVGYKDKYM